MTLSPESVFNETSFDYHRHWDQVDLLDRSYWFRLYFQQWGIFLLKLCNDPPYNLYNKTVLFPWWDSS